MTEPVLLIHTTDKQIKFDNNTKITVNFKMTIIIITIIAVIISGGWAFINHKIEKINNKLVLLENTDLGILKKVDNIDTKLNILLRIYGIKPLNTQKENTTIYLRKKEVQDDTRVADIISSKFNSLSYIHHQ